MKAPKRRSQWGPGGPKERTSTTEKRGKNGPPLKVVRDTIVGSPFGGLFGTLRRESRFRTLFSAPRRLVRFGAAFRSAPGSLGTPKIEQNHRSVVRKQSFAESRKSRFWERFLAPFGEAFGASGATSGDFFRKKAEKKRTEKEAWQKRRNPAPENGMRGPEGGECKGGKY